MPQGPNDRLKRNGTVVGAPKISRTVDIKIPDKEVHIMHPEEKPPSGGGTCSCHPVCTCVPVTACTCDTVSVCTCVPVRTCSCDLVCTCDSVCSTNRCACHPFVGCPAHICSCVPVCSCDGHCSTCSTCTTGGHYWYPN